MKDKKKFSVSAFARLVEVSPSAVVAAIDRGRIKTDAAGMVPESELKNWFKANRARMTFAYRNRFDALAVKLLKGVR